MPSIFEVYPDLHPRSVLTPGGSPQTDRRYLSWRRSFEAEVNSRWLDSRTRFGEDLPDREPINGPDLDEFLFVETGGSRLIDNFNYSHRLRHLSVCLASRPRKVIQLADQYAARRIFLLEGRP